MITIEPMFGLANRMRALDAALVLAADLGRPVRIVWNLNADLNCSFRSLFEVPAAVVSIEERHRHGWRRYDGPLVTVGTHPVFSRRLRAGATESVSAPLLLQWFRPANRWLLGRRTKGVALYESEVPILVDRQFDFLSLQRHEDIYIRACHQFCTRPPAFSRLRPAAALRDAVDVTAVSFTPETVGVHVRGRDRRRLNRAIVEAFASAMQAEVERMPATRFFLATDEPAAEVTLAQRFGDRLSSRPKRTLDRNCAEGIEDAVIDLYALSRTKKILGTRSSSYSHTAAAIRDVALTSVV